MTDKKEVFAIDARAALKTFFHDLKSSKVDSFVYRKSRSIPQSLHIVRKVWYLFLSERIRVAQSSRILFRKSTDVFSKRNSTHIRRRCLMNARGSETLVVFLKIFASWFCAIRASEP